MKGLLITSVSLSLYCNIAAVISSSYQHRCHTKHRASHFKVNLMLLFAVSWWSFSSLAVTVQQSGCSRKVHHTVFRISFVLSISCVLRKSKLALLAIRATFPGNFMRWVEKQQQILSVFAIIVYHVCISVLWWIFNISSCNKNMNIQKYNIIVKRSSGSVIQIQCILGQLGLVD